MVRRSDGAGRYPGWTRAGLLDLAGASGQHGPVADYDLTTSSASGPRLGVLHTPHGDVRTPAFMPVGTSGAVKGITPGQLAETGAEIMLCNTYHMRLRPGPEVIAQLGGLHKFIGWDKPILTDSGGFQVFSLARLNKITDEGVAFQSHVDGAKLFLDAKSAIEIQNQLGADIIMAFDQCPPYPAEREFVETAVRRTVRWAKESKDAHSRDDQLLFGIVQGGVHHDLRTQCAEALADIGFPGYAIGGLSVGESFEQMTEVLAELCPQLPEDRPRYLMGVGMPKDLVAAVGLGIDMFDCVTPTRHGRNAYAFAADAPLRMRNEKHKTDGRPLEEGCDCHTCRRFSRAYIRHCFMAGEMLGPILTSIHNLRFFQRLMGRIRDLIPGGELAKIYDEFPVTRPDAQP